MRRGQQELERLSSEAANTYFTSRLRAVSLDSTLVNFSRVWPFSSIQPYPLLSLPLELLLLGQHAPLVGARVRVRVGARVRVAG